MYMQAGTLGLQEVEGKGRGPVSRIFVNRVQTRTVGGMRAGSLKRGILEYVGPQDVRYTVWGANIRRCEGGVYSPPLSHHREILLLFPRKRVRACGGKGRTLARKPSQSSKHSTPQPQQYTYYLSPLQHTGCKFFLFARAMLPVAYAMLAARPMTVVAVPSVTLLLPFNLDWGVCPTDTLFQRRS